MKCVRIFTNNPDVRARYGAAARWVDGGVREVFCAVRDAVHMGAQVLSHPLSGSVKPWESPYKSVAVCTAGAANGRGAALHFQSLQLIEDAIAKLASALPTAYAINELLAADFRIIDLELIKGDFTCPSCTIFSS